MNKIITLILTLCFLFSSVGQAGAIYTPPTNVKPTKQDLAVATAFFNGVKFDVSQAKNNIIKVTVPKLDEKYAFSFHLRSMKENYEIIGDYNFLPTRGGVTTVNILPQYIAGFYLTMSNGDTGAGLIQDLWTYTPGDSQVRYIPVEKRIYPYLENGQIIYWVNDFGQQVNEDGTPYDPNSNDPTKRLDFIDVPASYWAFTVIKQLSTVGYIKGYPDKTFKPEGNITRAEYMVMLVNVLKDKWPDGSIYDHSLESSILPENHWSNDTVNLAFKYMPSNSIEQIFQTGFQPDKKITRVEVVTVLMSVLTSHPNFSTFSGSSQNFSDQLLSSYPQAIDFASRQGLVSGYPDGTFRPNGNITRAEIAAVMGKVLGKL